MIFSPSLKTEFLIGENLFVAIDTGIYFQTFLKISKFDILFQEILPQKTGIYT